MPAYPPQKPWRPGAVDISKFPSDWRRLFATIWDGPDRDFVVRTIEPDIARNRRVPR